MRERLFEHPVVFFSGCAVWIPIGIWIVAMVGWMIQGELDLPAGVMGICASGALGYFTMMPPIPELAPVFVVLAFSIVVLYPWARHTLNARELARIDVETLESCYLMLREKPGNVGAQMRMARLLYARGLPAHAIAISEAAIKNLPRIGFDEEMRLVAKWRERVAPEDRRKIVCVECGRENSLDAVFCAGCKSAYLLDYVKGRWIAKGQARRVVLLWSTLALALVLVPLITSTIEGPVGTATGLVVLAGAAVVAALVFRNKEGAEAR